MVEIEALRPDSRRASADFERLSEGCPGAKVDVHIRDRTGRILLGDVIVAYDGKPVRKRDDLERYVSQAKIGDTVVLTVRHGQEQIEVEVTLQGG